MRDPLRIIRICALLERYWHKYPDLRLGQIVVNLTNSNDPFYIEDDVLEAALREALKP